MDTRSTSSESDRNFLSEPLRLELLRPDQKGKHNLDPKFARFASEENYKSSLQTQLKSFMLLRDKFGCVSRPHDPQRKRRIAEQSVVAVVVLYLPTRCTQLLPMQNKKLQKKR